MGEREVKTPVDSIHLLTPLDTPGASHGMRLLGRRPLPIAVPKWSVPRGHRRVSLGAPALLNID